VATPHSLEPRQRHSKARSGKIAHTQISHYAAHQEADLAFHLASQEDANTGIPPRQLSVAMRKTPLLPCCFVDGTRFSTGSLILTFLLAIINTGGLLCARYIPMGSLCAMYNDDYPQSLFPEIRMISGHTKDMVSGCALQSVLFARVLSFYEWLLREQG